MATWLEKARAAQRPASDSMTVSDNAYLQSLINARQQQIPEAFRTSQEAPLETPAVSLEDLLPQAKIAALLKAGVLKGAMAAAPLAVPLKGLVKGAAKDVAKSERMSKAEAIARGYWHPVGSKKLEMPISEMRATYAEGTPMVEQKTISPEDMLGGVLIPVKGDRSIAGKTLQSINDVQLANPVDLEGGANFMRTHDPYGSFWATNAPTGLVNTIKRAAEEGKPIYAPFSAQGHESMNYNTMMTDTALQDILGSKITQKAIKDFDKEMRAVRPEWAGLQNPASREQLKKTGEVRHAFLNRMQLEKYQKAGFPNVDTLRWALTDKNLLDVPVGSSGYTIGRVNPAGQVISNPELPHSTYLHQLSGNYAGGLEQQIPHNVMYPDYFAARRAAGQPESGDFYSFYRANPVQQANQQWLDNVMQYLEQTKQRQ